MSKLEETLVENPVIAAIRNEKDLHKAVKSRHLKCLFLLEIVKVLKYEYNSMWKVKRCSSQRKDNT